MNKRKLFQSKNYNAKNETKSSKFNLNNFGNKNYSKSKKQAIPGQNQVSLIYFVSQFTDIQLTVGILFHRMDMDIENPVCPLQGPG